MSIVCKRVNFNDYTTSLIKIYSSNVTDTFNNTLHMISLHITNNVNMDIEIIGNKLHICKTIQKDSMSKNEVLSFLVNNVDTLYTLKLIIKNNINKDAVIYIGDYKFQITEHTINKEGNIKCVIKKIIDTSIDQKINISETTNNTQEYDSLYNQGEEESEDIEEEGEEGEEDEKRADGIDVDGWYDSGNEDNVEDEHTEEDLAEVEEDIRPT